MLKHTELALSTNSTLIAEIVQQPDLWPTTLERVLLARVPSEMLASAVILTGAGTSAYAAAAVADSWPGAKAIPTTDLLVQSASDMERSMPSFSQGGLLISLARSGDSPESVAVVERIMRMFPLVKHLAIVCNPDGRLARIPGVQVICLDPRTNDRSLAMTSSFSNLILAGLCLLHHKEVAAHLPSICSRVFDRLPAMNHAAAEIANNGSDRLVVLTSKMHALAEETSIKVLELTTGRVAPLPQTFLGLRHGPVSFLRDDTIVLCFASSNVDTRRYEMDLLRELHAKHLGRLVLVAESASGWNYDWFVPAIAPHLPDFLRTPFEIPFSQLLANHLSIHAQIDPDNPSPDGTVTRVVTQFRIHDELTPL